MLDVKTGWEKVRTWNEIAEKFKGDQLQCVLSIGENSFVNRLIDTVQRRRISRELQRHSVGRDGGIRFLDAGCGSGRMLSFLQSRTRLSVGADFSLEMLRIARRYCRESGLVCASLENLPFRSSHFDLIVTVGVIKVIPAFDAVVREVVRCTARGGHVLVLDNPSDRKKYGYQASVDPVTLYLSSFQDEGVELLAHSGVRWPVFLRLYRKVARKMLSLILRDRIQVGKSGELVFRDGLGRAWESCYDFGLKCAGLVNLMVDLLLAGVNFKRLAYEQIFLFRK